MIRLPYVKLGTIPYGAAVVKSKRSLPKVGDIIFIRYDNGKKNKYTNPWERVRIDKINDDGVCYFVSRI